MATTQTSHPEVELRGIPFAALTEQETVEEIIDRWQQGESGWVSTPNIQQLEILDREESLRELVQEASLVVADGMPLVWASALRGEPLPERVAGSNLVWSLARAAAENGASLFLLGGDDGVAERAGTTLEREVPGLRVVGTHMPPYGFEGDPEQMAEIHRQLQAAQPDFVYVGLGFPKQEILIRQLSRSFRNVWFLGIGASLSFISGDVPRAPSWMQRTGLEWVHRLCLEPRRLCKRYLLHGVPFTLALLVGSAARRVGRIAS